MNKKYYNNNNEKSLQRLINHIEGTYQSRKDVCLSLCKLINTTLNAQTYVINDDVNLNTFIGFEDKSSIMVFQNAQGDFGIPDKTLEFSQAHQFYFVIKYLCTKLYNIDSENCQKVFVGNDLGNYVDIEHIKSVFIDDATIKDMKVKKYQFQDTEFTVKEMYLEFVKKAQMLNELYGKARVCHSILRKEYDNSLKPYLEIWYLKGLWEHSQKRFNDIFISDNIPWNLFWSEIEECLTNEDYNLHKSDFAMSKHKLFNVLTDIKTCLNAIKTFEEFKSQIE